MSNEGNCILQDVENCTEFKRNENICTKCFNNFYVNNSYCTPISSEFKENCRETETHKNGCLFCSNGFFKSSNQCIMPYTRSIISNCLFTSTNENNGCEECMSGFRVVNIMSECKKLPSGCSEFQSNVARCNKCKEFHEGDNQGGCLPYPTQANCTQLIAGVFTTFDQAVVSGTCENCSDYDRFYLQNGKCEQRKNFVVNCLHNKKNEDRCKVCIKDSVLTEVQGKVFCHEKNIPTMVLNCFAHDIFDPEICRQCKIGNKYF